MSRYLADGWPIAEQLPLTVGDRIRLLDGTSKPWTVQAVSEHFAACVQQAPFQPAGVLRYTVLDWRNGVRGPCDLIGQGYGDGTYSPAECTRMLRQFESGRLSVSHRNWVRLEVTPDASHERAATP